MRPAGRIRLIDIASDAGVSIATVDRVINDRKGVSARTRARVRDAIQRLNYIPNMAAQSLSRRAAFGFDFVLPDGPSAYVNILRGAVQEAAAAFSDFRVESRVHLVRGLDPHALAECLNSLVGISNGIAVLALEHPRVREAVNRLAGHNIPVVTLTSDLGRTRRLAYIGFDNLSAGRTAGQLMGRWLSGCSGDVAILTGSLQYRSHQDRELGFRQILGEEFSNLRIVELAEVRNDLAVAYDRCAALLRAHPDLIGIYNVGAGHRGVARALKEADRVESVTYIGHELTAHTRQFLLDGTMDAVIAQDPQFQTSTAIRLLLHHNLGQKVGSMDGHVSANIYVRENLPRRQECGPSEARSAP